jgi:hypothetical protein
MITDTNKHLLLTQASILEYLLSQQDWSEALDQCISEWVPFTQLVFPKGLVQINDNITVEQGFDKLIKSGLPALPLVSSNLIKGVLENENIMDFIHGNAFLNTSILEFIRVK